MISHQLFLRERTTRLVECADGEGELLTVDLNFNAGVKVKWELMLSNGPLRQCALFCAVVPSSSRRNQ